MAKKAVKKSSSSRRVTARPLGFWQFIRKNLLIISGLLLLPVTVGAVVSSYNYANQGSAAGRNTFTTQALKECSAVPGISNKKVAAGACVNTNTEYGYCRCLGGDFVIDKQYRCGLNSSCQNPLAVPTVASPVCASKEYKPLGCKSCLVVCRTRDGKSLDSGVVEVTDFGCNQEIRKVTECGAPSPAPTSPPADTGRGGGGYTPNCGQVKCQDCGSESQGCCRGTDFETCCGDKANRNGGCNDGLQCVNGGCSRPAAPTSAPTPVPQTSSDSCAGSESAPDCKDKKVGYKILTGKYDDNGKAQYLCQCQRTTGNNCSCYDPSGKGINSESAGFDVKKAIKNFFGIFGF